MPEAFSRHCGSRVGGLRSKVAQAGRLRTSPTSVDQQAVELVVVLDHDAHALVVAFARLQAEAPAHVDGGDDAAAQVQRTGMISFGASGIR